MRDSELENLEKIMKNYENNVPVIFKGSGQGRCVILPLDKSTILWIIFPVGFSLRV